MARGVIMHTFSLNAKGLRQRRVERGCRRLIIVEKYCVRYWVVGEKR